MGLEEMVTAHALAEQHSKFIDQQQQRLDQQRAWNLAFQERVRQLKRLDPSTEEFKGLLGSHIAESSELCAAAVQMMDSVKEEGEKQVRAKDDEIVRLQNECMRLECEKEGEREDIRRLNKERHILSAETEALNEENRKLRQLVETRDKLVMSLRESVKARDERDRQMQFECQTELQNLRNQISMLRKFSVKGLNLNN